MPSEAGPIEAHPTSGGSIEVGYGSVAVSEQSYDDDTHVQHAGLPRSDDSAQTGLVQPALARCVTMQASGDANEKDYNEIKGKETNDTIEMNANTVEQDEITTQQWINEEQDDACKLTEVRRSRPVLAGPAQEEWRGIRVLDKLSAARTTDEDPLRNLRMRMDLEPTDQSLQFRAHMQDMTHDRHSMVKDGLYSKQHRSDWQLEERRRNEEYGHGQDTEAGYQVEGTQDREGYQDDSGSYHDELHRASQSRYIIAAGREKAEKERDRQDGFADQLNQHVQRFPCETRSDCTAARQPAKKIASLREQQQLAAKARQRALAAIEKMKQSGLNTGMGRGVNDGELFQGMLWQRSSPTGEPAAVYATSSVD